MTKRSGVGQAPEINGGNGIEEYAADELRDNGDESSSRGSRFTLIQSAIGLASTRRTSSRQTLIDGLRDLSRGLVIHPDNRSVYMHTFLPPYMIICIAISTRSSVILSSNCFATNPILNTILNMMKNYKIISLDNTVKNYKIILLGNTMFCFFVK